ncbi:hypothetical protein N7492_005446 [Penicillium capsulatum]|uniref:Bromo domain-containing protein n=1 Tax=Penicillium capsulatum TaxID=69766 RepID=A0A9W9LS41_9EURO|nr:hypothetical protein N7492_005446 [Penicillium capsulatum]
MLPGNQGALDTTHSPSRLHPVLRVFSARPSGRALPARSPSLVTSVAAVAILTLSSLPIPPNSSTVAPIPQILLSSRPGGQWGMPPLSTYTHFESLLFFQSLASSETRPASFASISNTLRNNPLVRQHVGFNADRLTPAALEDLYTTLLRDGFDRDVTTSSNPKKRKISSPRPDDLPDGATHATLIPDLVSHLYARYRDLVTKEIREDEKRGWQTGNPGQGPQVAKIERKDSMDITVKQEVSQQDQQELMDVSGDAVASQGKEAQPTKPSTAVPPALDTPRPTGKPSQPQGARGQNAQPPLAPRPPGPATPAAAAPVAPHANAPIAPAASHPTPTQSSFQQWQLDPPLHSPYAAVSPGTVPPQAGSTPAKQPPLTASQVSSGTLPKPPPSSTVPNTPIPAPSAVHTPVPIGRPHLSQTPSVVIPSFSESRASRPRLSIDTPGSSTPWKRTPRLSIPLSPASPPRPRPEDVSPISERAPSPGAMGVSPPRERKSRRGQVTGADSKTAPDIKTEKPSTSTTRRKRALSSLSSQSRGRSVASREASLEVSEEADRDSRASARRKGAVDDSATKGRPKRKRGVSESLEQEASPPDVPKVDTSRFVVCTRGFHRTAAPILNDVTTHKLASIFAKPLSERDAPGYHDLIYRPQDLKSIKSAVHLGSKMVGSATEAVSTPAGDGESPVPAGTPSKQNVLMMPKSEDLMPPKGIVNSAQLEKEFIRMFANAIMFNPVPERGLGPAFTLINERGSRESTQSGEGDDEGGIIQDSREMFEDVEQAVTRWRAAERTADELANKNVLSLRRGSASDFNTDSTDDAKG